MCGICGIIDFKNQIQNKVNFTKLMSENLSHRGPDDYGDYNDDDITLGFTRLSIIDVQSGNQPMFNKNKNIISIFNGEIYNYQEIKQELILKGYTFYSNSDSEIIPKAFENWGIDFVKKLNGMFSIAIYDKRNKDFYLIRDRLGIKPLNYFKYRDSLFFSSEINSLTSLPVFKKEINFKAISAYLSFRYPTEDENTFFRGIKRLPAGSYLKLNINNEKILSYWKIPFPKSEKIYNEDYYLQKLDYLLNKSVKRQLISDVPLGVFLSGGLDSSLLSSVASKNVGRNLNTFSVTLEEAKYNESEKAKLVSSYLGTNHTEVVLKKEDFLDNLNNLMDIKGVPASIPHEYALYLLSKEMKKKISVVLSGEGADEFFGGYSRVQGAPFDFHKNYYLNKYSFGLIKKEKSFYEFIMKRYNWFSPEEKNQLLTDDFKNRTSYDKLLNSSWEKNLEGSFLENDYNKILHMFQNKHLKCLLDRLDTMTMAASIEARVPFLDHEIVEFINTVPFKFKLKWKSNFHKIISLFSSSKEFTEKNDINKYLLRKLSTKYLPNKISQAKKLGFPVPMNDWIDNNEIKNIIGGKNSLTKNFYNSDYLNEILHMRKGRDYDFAGKKIWMLLNIEIWVKKHFG